MAQAGVYRDYVSGPQSWAVTSVGDKIAAIGAGGVPILADAGWLDAGTANGVLSEFTSLSNTQEDWVGPWSHGQGYLADPFQPSRLLTAAEHQQLADARYAFFDRYVKGDARPGGTRLLHYYTLEDVAPDGRVTYITEGELALADRALASKQDNPAWRRLRTPRTYAAASAAPFPQGSPQQVTFDLLPTSVLFRASDRIRITIAAADPDSFQLLPADGQASYEISHSAAMASSVELPMVG
jgi:predicted acyl esterase